MLKVKGNPNYSGLPEVGVAFAGADPVPMSASDGISIAYFCFWHFF
jgi:hypothetical protein